jgi:hypothetical protein
VPTVPFATTLYGVVRHPVALAGGPWPLVLLIHGNHGICRASATATDDDCATSTDHDCPWSGWLTTPNAEGLAYLAETLAAQGYVAVSISANALNCRDDYILPRAQLVVEHLRRWQGWATAGGAPFGATFAGVVDLGRVGLVGHSRGGEAVAHVPAVLAATPVAGVTLGGIFSIAPTDYHDPDPSGVPYAVLLPACDGDVSTLSGMHIYDRALGDGEPERAQVLMTAANHNFYSTEWKGDDGLYACSPAVMVGAPAQQAMLETTLSAWFAGTAGDGALEPFLRADADTPLGISAWAGVDLDLRWSFAAPGRLPIDAFAGPGSPGTNLLGGANTFVEYVAQRQCVQTGCDSSFEHAKAAMLLSWDGGTPRAAFGLAGLDATGFGAISFRVVSRASSYNSGEVDQDFFVRVVDAGGDAAEVLVSSVRRVPHLYSGYDVREILQTVRVPIAALAEANAALDLDALQTFELEMTAPGHGRGSVLITDLEVAD